MKSKEYTSYDLYKHILDNINQEFQFQKNQEYETLIEPDEGAKNLDEKLNEILPKMFKYKKEDLIHVGKVD